MSAIRALFLPVVWMLCACSGTITLKFTPNEFKDRSGQDLRRAQQDDAQGAQLIDMINSFLAARCSGAMGAGARKLAHERALDCPCAACACLACLFERVNVLGRGRVTCAVPRDVRCG